MSTASVEDRAAVERALATVTDPCMQASGLGISIIDMGLINGISVSDTEVEIKLTFTEVGCPFAMRLLDDAEKALAETFPGRSIAVRPDWSPPWVPERLSDSARATLAESGTRLRRLMPAAAAQEQARQQATAPNNP